MGKRFLLLCLASTLLGCGQKSTIKDAIPSHSFATCEGKYICRDASLAIVPDDFDAVLPNMGVATPLVGGLARLFMKVGLVSGTRKFTLNQPIPTLPHEYISSIKLSRVFFVIEEENFDFIENMVVMVTPKPIHNPYGSLTSSPTKESKLNAEEKDRYYSLFDDQSILGQMDGMSADKDVIVLKYSKSGNANNKYAHAENLDYVYIINTDKPAATLDYMLFNLKFKEKNYLKKFEILGANSLLIELNPDQAIRSIFDHGIKEISTNPALEFKGHVPCTARTCLDIAVPNINFLPLVIKENSLQLDAIVEVGNAPKAFRIKGYIQFGVKIKDPLKDPLKEI